MHSKSWGVQSGKLPLINRIFLICQKSIFISLRQTRPQKNLRTFKLKTIEISHGHRLCYYWIWFLNLILKKKFYSFDTSAIRWIWTLLLYLIWLSYHQSLQVISNRLKPFNFVSLFVHIRSPSYSSFNSLQAKMTRLVFSSLGQTFFVVPEIIRSRRYEFGLNIT